MSKNQIQSNPNVVAITDDTNALRKLKISLGIIVAAFAFILYAQSISFDYTMDDHPAIDLNKITTKGFSGIPTLLKTDYWYGFKDELRGPVYRPTSLIIFAFIWQISPNSPHIYHLINVIFYSLTCMILFLVLCKLFDNPNAGRLSNGKEMKLLFPFVCALLYTAHPIHTEVVNNIKSLDEILCFFFGICSILFILSYFSTNSVLSLILGSVSFFLSLISKETGITFLIIIPLTIYVFRDLPTKKLITISLILFCLSTIYFLMKIPIFKDVHMNVSSSVLNNTLINEPDFIKREATVFYILLRYVILLIFPHPLTCDYNFSQIKIHNLSDLFALIGIVLYFGMGIYAIMNFRKKSIIAFGILFYLISLVPVSNVFLLIGSTMAERFMYTPSLGFCLIVSYLMIKLLPSKVSKSKFQNLSQMIKVNTSLFGILFIIIGLYSIKTYSRSSDWKDNYTIFNRDVETSDNSATAHICLANALLLDIYPKERNKDKKDFILDRSISEFLKAIKIYNDYSDAYHNLGIAYYNKGDYQNALKSYEIAQQLFPKPNAMLLSNIGNLYGTIGQYQKGLNVLDSAIKYKPDYADAYNNKGFILSSKGEYLNAIIAFNKAIELNSKFELAYQNLGSAYGNMKQYSKSLEYYKKAIAMDTADAENYKWVGTLYLMTGDSIKAKVFLDKATNIGRVQK